MTAFEVDQFLPHPPAKVWRFLTEPDAVATWWAAARDIKPVVGHAFTVDMGAWGHQPCEVLEVVEPERLVYSFTERWQLTWTLVPEGTGTRLLLEHSGFDLDDPQDRFAFDNMGQGWRDEILPRLTDVLAAD
ncbi:MAG: hypothetical protein JWN67_5182 [Actinomycetia bacterium]|nr:hypothetical protein [Actinomycetes bacterium]